MGSKDLQQSTPAFLSSQLSALKFYVVKRKDSWILPCKLESIRIAEMNFNKRKLRK